MIYAVLICEIDSDLLGEAREVWYTVYMLVRFIVRHQYHLHAGIFTGGEQYSFRSSIFHKHLKINIIMVVSGIQIGYPDYLGSQRKRSGGLVDCFDVYRINVRGIALPFDFVKRPPFDHVNISHSTILHDIMNEDQTPAS